MKKFILVFLLVTGLLAGATTATVNLKGTVPGLAEISFTPTIDVSTLDFSYDVTVTDLELGAITERTNNKTGYTVTLNSANNFTFVNTGFGESFPYTLKYNDVSVDTNDSTVTDSNEKTTGTGIDKGLSISYTPTFVSDGDYEDTLTLTLGIK